MPLKSSLHFTISFAQIAHSTDIPTTTECDNNHDPKLSHYKAMLKIAIKFVLMHVLEIGQKLRDTSILFLCWQMEGDAGKSGEQTANKRNGRKN